MEKMTSSAFEDEHLRSHFLRPPHVASGPNDRPLATCLLASLAGSPTSARFLPHPSDQFPGELLFGVTGPLSF
jgi:hypothetical protein